MDKKGFFFLFGWGYTTTNRQSERPLTICTHCHSNYLYLTKVTSWGTLFFIPIIPYESDYYFLCPTCDYGYKIEQEKIKKIKKILEENNLKKFKDDGLSSNGVNNKRKKKTLYECELCGEEFDKKKLAERHEKNCKREEGWFSNFLYDLKGLVK